MSTRKVGKFNRNNRKSNKKYIKKRRKYTQKGRGLGDRAQKIVSSASKAVNKFTRGPVNRESMRELQQEMKKRKEERQEELKKIENFSDKVSRDDCPLCLENLQDEAGEARKVDTTYTLGELKELQEKSGVCQPCGQCEHPFHIGCVEDMYSKKSNKSSICPLCRDESFREFQNTNYVTKRLQGNKDKLAKLQSELREMGNRKGPPPPRYNEIQSILKELELDIQCETDWLDPNISEDEYIKRWRRRR
jgi:hypothetical protein